MKVPFCTVYDFFPDIDKDRNPAAYIDIREPVFWEVFEACRSYTLIPIERFYNIFKSVEHVALHGVPGDFVECGVFLGGAGMAMALFADHFGVPERKTYLYDTFSGFGEEVVEVNHSGVEERFPVLPDFLGAVVENIDKLGLDRDRFVIVKGPVEETLLETRPESVALLRLDTDYYQSTLVELEQLYPRLNRGGVLILDDFGHFRGVQEATEHYFSKHEDSVLLHRIDYSCRSGIKL